MTITMTKNRHTTIYSHPELGPVARIIEPAETGGERQVWLAVGPDEWIEIDSRFPDTDARRHAESL